MASWQAYQATTVSWPQFVCCTLKKIAEAVFPSVFKMAFPASLFLWIFGICYVHLNIFSELIQAIIFFFFFIICLLLFEFWKTLLWRLSGNHHISRQNVWNNCCTTISLWSPTNLGAKIFVLVRRFRICNNICTFILGYGSHRAVWLNIYIFFLPLVRFETWTLKYQKSIFIKTFGLFQDMIWHDGSFLSFDNQFIPHL